MGRLLGQLHAVCCREILAEIDKGAKLDQIMIETTGLDGGFGCRIATGSRFRHWAFFLGAYG